MIIAVAFVSHPEGIHSAQTTFPTHSCLNANSPTTAVVLAAPVELLDFISSGHV